MAGRTVTLTLNPVVDIRTEAERVRSDAKIRCAAPDREPGGGGINVARVLKRLGGEPLALFPGGGGPAGDLSFLLAAEDVAHRIVPIDGPTRENLLVREQATGAEFRFTMPGPTLTEEAQVRIGEELAALAPAPDFLVVSGSLPPGASPAFLAHLVRAAAERGIRPVVDPSGQGLCELAAPDSGVYMLTPNGGELSQLAQRELASEEALAEAASGLLAGQRERVVVVTLGAQGALLVTPEARIRFRAPNVPVASRLGAGDTMLAGLVHRLGEGAGLAEAVRFGVAAGTAAAASPGNGLEEGVDLTAILEQTEAA